MRGSATAARPKLLWFPLLLNRLSTVASLLLLLPVSCGQTTRNPDLAADRAAAAGGTTAVASTQGQASSSSTSGRASSAGERNPAAMFRGHYSTGFEHSGFKMCGEPADARGWWWNSANLSEGRELLDALGPNPGNPGAPRGVYVELDGTLSKVGEWGHLGSYERELSPAHLYYVAHSSVSDCD